MAKKQYSCSKCKKNHLVTSKIGKKHKEFAEKAVTKTTATKKKTTKKKSVTKPHLPELPDINKVKAVEKGFGFFSGILILVLVAFFAALTLFTFQQSTLDEFRQQESLTTQLKKRLSDTKYYTAQFTEGELAVEGVKNLPENAWTEDGNFYYRQEVDGVEKSYLYNVATEESAEQEIPEVEVVEEDEEELPENQTQTKLYSPDKNKVALITRITEDDKTVTTLMVRDLEEETSTEILTVNNEEQMEVTWSPDSEYLIYNYGKQLWLVRADGERNRQLTTYVRSYLQPRWSEDGESLLYIIDGRIYISELKLKNILSKKVDKKIALR